MANEIAPLQGVQDAIRDKIKSEFVGLIPEDMWKKMVESVISEFIQDSRGRYNNEVTPSPMKEMIRNEILILAKEKLKAELDKLSAGQWGDFGSRSANDALTKLIAANFKDILQSVQAGFVDMAVGVAVNHMRNAVTNGGFR